VDQILSDISKGVTTHSRLANFCEHYSFVSSMEPFRVEAVGVLGPTAHPGLPLKVFLGVGRCQRL
jgi:hypothetical protein